MNHLESIFITFIPLFVLACTQSEPSPRSPHWNEDVCARCRMTLSVPAHAAQLVGSGGRVRHYDDLGCLVLDLHQNDELDDMVAWVMSPTERQTWVRARDVRFAEGVATPMDYGYAPAEDGSLSYSEIKDAILRDEEARGEK